MLSVGWRWRVWSVTRGVCAGCCSAGRRLAPTILIGRQALRPLTRSRCVIGPGVGPTCNAAAMSSSVLQTLVEQGSE
jgi:hypothetical protein